MIVALIATFVAVLGATLAAGRPLIALLRRVSFRQNAYEDAPQTHAKKTGTPTMGGALFLIPLLVAMLAYPGVVTVALAVVGVGCGLVGFVDDYTSVRRGRNRGLSARSKFLATVVVGVLFLGLAQVAARTDAAIKPGVIFTTGAAFGDVRVVAPYVVWWALGLLAILATTHAVNLTDGLDGLAGGTMLPPLAVVAFFGWQNGAYGVAFVDVALMAAVLGFLAYNRHPARVFMGDTGALLLGGVLAGSVVLTGTHLLLPLIGGVFAAEALSVIIQVAYFKTTHKRIFRMSPLHHHFELGGWPETKVTARFWTASALLSLAGAAIVR
ncbi:MAG: phospho-N-acetylmuramoyl-pentapeptide-transferase [Vulcanimicrobiaceae bacterium]